MSKLPSGIKSFADRINATGLKFRLLIEPEMINRDSELYGEYPDWRIRVDYKRNDFSTEIVVFEACD